MRRSWKVLGNTITPDYEAATTSDAQRGAEGKLDSPQPCIPRSYEARRRTAIRARIPRPTSATAATRGRKTPPVSGNFGATLAEALADGLADALAEGVVISPPPETLTLAIIWGWIVHW